MVVGAEDAELGVARAHAALELGEAPLVDWAEGLDLHLFSFQWKCGRPSRMPGRGSTTDDLSCESPLPLCPPTLSEQLLPVGVQHALRFERLTEALERREERLDLVQRVGPLRCSRDVELEVDPVGAVRELEN